MWLAMLALGCSDAPDPGPKGTDVGPPDTAVPTPTGDTASDPTPTEPLVPLIGEALADLCGDTLGGDDPGEGSLHRLTLVGDDVVCNDGTAAVAYVRAATDPAHLDDWVLYLEPGAYCDDYDSCVERWCAERPLMTGGGPQARSGTGLLSDEPDNPVGGFNIVFFQYCTSDLWSGRQADVVLDGSPSFRMHLTGRTIIDAALTQLDGGATSDDGVETLPALSTASKVVWGGASAGGFGALLSLDDVAARLDADVLGLFDGVTSPAESVLDPAILPALEASRVAQYDRFEALFEMQLDASCQADQPAAERWRCLDPAVLELQYLQTPFQVVGDLRDIQVGVRVLDAGATIAELGVANEATFRALAAARPEVGVWASACQRHIILTEEPWYSGVPVLDALAGPPPRTARDAVGAWVQGSPEVSIAGPAGSGVRCP